MSISHRAAAETLSEIMQCSFVDHLAAPPSEPGSLVKPDMPVPYETVRAHRGGKTLQNEYFAAQVLAAAGLPIPNSILVKKGAYTYVQSQQLTPNIDPTKCKELSCQFSAGITTQFLAEAVIQDGDGIASAADGDNVLIEQNLEIFRVTYDRERAAATRLSPKTLAEYLKNLQEVHAQPNSPTATIEEELAMVAKLNSLLTDGTLHKIFHNKAVESTIEFDKKHSQDLFEAWAHNIQVLHAHYSEKYDVKLFSEREKIRGKLAEKIIERLKIKLKDSSFATSQFRQKLIENLRKKMYFENPETISRTDLEQESLIETITAQELERLKRIEIDRELNDRILLLLEDVEQTKKTTFAQAFYQEKRRFLSEIFRKYPKISELDSKQKEEILQTFLSGIKKYKGFLIAGASTQELVNLKKISELIEKACNEKTEKILKRFYSKKASSDDCAQIIRICKSVKAQCELYFFHKYFSHLDPRKESDANKIKEIRSILPNIDLYLKDKKIFGEFNEALNDILLEKIPAILESADLSIDNINAIFEALSNFFDIETKPFIEDRFFDKENAICYLFSADIPNGTREEKIEFLKKEMGYLFARVIEKLEHQKNGELSPTAICLEEAYLDCRMFLEKSAQIFENMLKSLGLEQEDKEIQELKERFQKNCLDLSAQWEREIPRIKKLKGELYTTNRFWSEYFIANIGPNTTTASQTVFSASANPYGLHSVPKTDENFLVHIYIDEKDASGKYQSKEYQLNLAKECIKHYQNLFKHYIKPGELLPTVSLIPPKDDTQFKENGYLLHIKFLNAAQRQALLSRIAEDCYDPSLMTKKSIYFTARPDSFVWRQNQLFDGFVRKIEGSREVLRFSDPSAQEQPKPVEEEPARKKKPGKD